MSVAAALPSAAIAVIANVTAVSPSGVGHLTVYPDGLATPPEASNIDYLAGQVIPNRVIVKLGSDGNIDVYSLKATNVIVDISGYYTAAGGTGAVFVPAAAPLRICDTRANNGLAGTQAQCNGKPNSANPLGPNTTRTVQVTGQPGVPTGAIAAVVNVTGVYPTQTTHLIVYPGGTPPGTSDLDPAAGAVEPNLVVPTLSTSGSFTVYNYAGTINLVVDLTGWYENYPAPPSGLVAVAGLTQAALSWAAPAQMVAPPCWATTSSQAPARAPNPPRPSTGPPSSRGRTTPLPAWPLAPPITSRSRPSTLLVLRRLHRKRRRVLGSR